MSVFKYKVLAFVFYAAYVVGIGQSQRVPNSCAINDDEECKTTDGKECFNKRCIDTKDLELCKAHMPNVVKVYKLQRECSVFCGSSTSGINILLPDNTKCFEKMECINNTCVDSFDLKVCDKVLPNATNVRVASLCSYECYNENGGSVKVILEDKTKCGVHVYFKECYKGQCALPEAIKKCSDAKKDYRIIRDDKLCVIYCYDKDNQLAKFQVADGEACEMNGICKNGVCR